MANVITYGAFSGALLNKEIDWDTDTIKVLLTTSTYTPSQDAHDYKDDVTNEVTGTGYTAGGATLGTKSNSYDGGTNVRTLDAADVSWASSTITARYAVIYVDTGSAATSPLIGYLNFESDKSSSSGTFQITWGVNGIITFTHSAS